MKFAILFLLATALPMASAVPAKDHRAVTESQVYKNGPVMEKKAKSVLPQKMNRKVGFKVEAEVGEIKPTAIKDLFQEEGALWDLFVGHTMSMSLSLSMPTPTPASPTPVTPTPVISSAPVTTPTTGVPIPAPTFAPLPSFIPTSIPTVSPTVMTMTSDMPSIVLSDMPSPTLFTEPPLFICTEDGGVGVAEPPYSGATKIMFTVEYVIESGGFLDEFEGKLEDLILGTALSGALGCSNNNITFGCAECPPDFVFTYSTGEQCNPTISFCQVIKSEFEVVVAANIDPDVAAYLGYLALQEKMNNGDFMAAIPDLDRIEYRGPTVEPPPASTPLQEGEEPISVQGESLTVSPWTIGAVLAMSIGGVAAMWTWARNRQGRNRRQLQHMEELSMGPQSTFSD